MGLPEVSHDNISHQARLELARRKFEKFIPLVEPAYDTGWAQLLIQRKLQKFIRDVQDQKSPRLMICLPPRHPLADDTPVFTPDGWRLHGDLKPGDRVYHPSGKVVRVRAVSDRTEMTHIVKAGGTEIVAGPYHLWEVNLSGAREPVRIMDTLELVDLMATASSRTPRLRVAHVPMQVDNGRRMSGMYEWGLKLRASFGRGRGPKVAFPSGVLDADVQSRLEFTAGLLEQGRRVVSPHLCQLATSDLPLLHKMVKLFSSVGCRVRYSRADQTGVIYRIRVRIPPGVPFRTKPVGEETRKRQFLTIESVYPLPKDKVVLGRCIEVDAEDGLYLAGEACITTHNSKSLTVSQLLPMWGLGVDPTLEFVVASYGMSLPAKFSRRVRATVRDDALYHEIFPDTQLHPDNQSVEDWETTLGGGFRPVGRGGALTGKGAHCLIIDDLLKDASEADSPVIREAAIDWYSSTAYTRLYPGAGVIIVMTRWHVEDLAGVELEKMAKAQLAKERGTLLDDYLDPDDVDQWELVSLPAVAEQNEYLSPDIDDLYTGDDPPPGYTLIRKPGDALHRSRYDERALARIKAALLPRHWVALYQQSPLPEDGAFFELEQFMYGPLPDLNDCTLAIAADTAASTEQSADESCIMLGAMDRGRNIRLVEAVVGRYNVYAFCDLLLDMYMRYPEAVVVGIESGPLREAIMPVLEQLMRERDIYPPLADKAEMRPSVSKEVRARPVQGILQAGRLWLPRNDPQNPPPAWVQKLLHQMRLFPQSSDDDMVDTLAWLVRLLLARGVRTVRRNKPRQPTWRDRLNRMTRKPKTFMGA